MRRLDADTRFELMKLLAQVALSDGTIDVDESRFIQRLGRHLLLANAALAEIETWGRQTRPPPPNLGLLRRHRDVVIEVCLATAEADGVLHQDEVFVIEDISQLLS